MPHDVADSQEQTGDAWLMHLPCPRGMSRNRRSAHAAATMLLCAIAPAQWQAPTAADLVPPVRHQGPLLACSTAELQNLRNEAAIPNSPAQKRVNSARKRLGVAVLFPPRGGQHNQWYQCDACQIALVTVDATHHQCPQCQKVYRGAPYDDVVFARQHGHNLARASDAAWAFALTDEQVFATDAKAILLGYAARYEGYPHHSNDRDPSKPRDSGGHLYAQTLTEASAFVTQIAPAIDLVWPALDEAERAQLLQHLVRPLVQNLAKCKRGMSNWQSWHNAALFAGGVLLEDAKLMRRSVLDRKDGFCCQMEHCVSPEGMWHENSFGYHLYTLDALAWHASFARRAGIDLFGNPALHAMCTLPARYLMADGTLPRLGDDVSSTPKSAAGALEAAFAATGDAKLLAALPARTTWESIAYGRDVTVKAPTTALASELFRGAGHAILRAEGPSRATAMLTFSPFGGFHGHFDKLSFVWHAFESERGVDPGRAASQAYRLPIHNGWYRATLAHNGVVVDGHSQQGASGELLGFVTGEGFSAAAAHTTEAYAGVDHRRCLVLTSDYLVVLDQLASDKEHTYDWLYHDAGQSVECSNAPASTEQPLGIDGEPFVQWQRQGSTGEPIAVHFAGERVSTRLHVAAVKDTLVRTGSGPFRSTVDRAPFVLLRRAGQGVHFAAVLSAETAAVPSVVTAVHALEGGELGVRVERGTASDVITWDGGGEVTFTRGCAR
jgi:oligo-alginate lyase